MDRFLGLDPPAGGASTSGKKPVTARKKYPIRAEDYELCEPVGQGVSACVYRAICIPLNETVAIKLVDFERANSDLANICREAQTMILIDHPNVLKAHCSFVKDQHLWVVMPYMEGGSCLHIMKSAFPDGLEEPVIATVLREALKGLEYLHSQGQIHRDVKAGNILVDSRGAIKLGDFGVSACLFDSGDRQRSRNTFVGTPCWMAPEVMEQLHGYDFRADIWSFGITALELAHGHAPFSKHSPMKILMMTLQNAPPGLDYESDKKFTKSFKEMLAMCLVKEPSMRPSAKKLLKQPFFKQARSQDYMVRKVLDGLPSLDVRHQILKDKERAMLAEKKMPDSEKEELSQNEYKKGISAWNFDIEDLKAQASLIPDDEDDKESNEYQIPEIYTPEERAPETEPCSSVKGGDGDKTRVPHERTLPSSDQPGLYQSTKSGTSGNEIKIASRRDQDILQRSMPTIREEKESNESCRQSFEEKHLENVLTQPSNEQKASMNSPSSELVPSSKGERKQNQPQINGNCNGDVHKVIDAEAMPKSSKSASPDDVEDKMKHTIVQRKGRFKVMSENVDKEKGLPPVVIQRSHSMQMFSQIPSPSVIGYVDASGDLGCSVFPQLHSILQTNIQQRDNILSLMKQLSISELSTNRSTEEKSLLEVAHEKEKELLQEISELQWRLISTQDELKRIRARNTQLNNVEGHSAAATGGGKQL